jgi:uncharacterized phiE125 gp8 family phage protein
MLKYSLHRSSEPASEPVSLAELKNYLRVEHTTDDAELAAVLTAARQAVERDTGRSLITQTWVLQLDQWPCRYVQLPQPPIVSVTSVTYVDAAGVTQTWAATNYVVDIRSRPGLIRLAYECDWPAVRGDERGIAVTYVAGYGATAASVPADLRQAVKHRARLDYDAWSEDVAMAYSRIVQSNIVGVLPGA